MSTTPRDRREPVLRPPEPASSSTKHFTGTCASRLRACRTQLAIRNETGAAALRADKPRPADGGGEAVSTKQPRRILRSHVMPTARCARSCAAELPSPAAPVTPPLRREAQGPNCTSAILTNQNLRTRQTRTHRQPVLGSRCWLLPQQPAFAEPRFGFCLQSSAEHLGLVPRSTCS